jgi:hypothetical protein
MCEIVWLPQALIWSFAIVSLALALVSRKLDGHLLILPTEPTGPFAILFRRKYHLRLSYLRDPARHFDATGQRWVRLFIRLLAIAAALFALIAVVIQGCGWTFSD